MFNHFVVITHGPYSLPSFYYGWIEGRLQQLCKEIRNNLDRFNGEIQELIDLLEESGMKVLYDQYVEVEDRLALIGRKDYSDKDRAELAE
ncbi:hypothetical protein [Paenibacillus sp. NPDC057967]|uniref:hypothetical protein n=1 Tax=Paenibacillus sp. NPDC057967 TaxID=3346293 RepID=UPI0036DD8AC9